MTRRTVIHANRTYEVTPDIPGRDRVFLIGTLADDADGRPLARAASLTASETFVFAANSEREIGLAGNPLVAFADRSVAHDMTLSFAAEGYRSATEVVTIPAMAAFPHRQDFTLRRKPIQVRGRVFGQVAGPPPANLPLASATISLEPVADAAGNFPLLLRQPLRADQSAGATIRRRSTGATTDLVVIEPALRGGQLIGVTDGTGVVAGQLLRFGVAERPVYAEVASVVGHPDFPAPAALVEVTEPLPTSLRSAAVLERFVLGGFSGPTGTLSGQSYAGESVLLLNALPSSGGVLMLSAPGQPDRFHDANIQTGPSGDYLVEGLARQGSPSFVVSAAGLTPQTISYPLDRLGQGPVDWFLTP